MQLKSLTPATSPDGEHVRLTFEGQEDEKTNVDMRLNEFTELLSVLVEFNIQCQIGKSLPVQNPETELPSTDHALLLAKEVKLMRWESDACALQIQTTLGAAFQIGLSPEQVAFLRHALHKNI